LLKWEPIGKRKGGRLKTKWKDDMVAMASRSRTDMARDRQRWSSQRIAFAQQWGRDG